MDAYETRFARQLEKRLAEAETARINQIIQGIAQDFPDYRERVGYLRACGDFRAFMEEVRAEMTGDKS